MADESSNPVGRPTVITPEILKKLEEAFAYGASDNEACFYANISPSSLYAYQKENPEFTKRKVMLKSRPILMARKSVVDNLAKKPYLSLKFLERKKKDEFSPKIITEETGQIKHYVISRGTGTPTGDSSNAN